MKHAPFIDRKRFVSIAIRYSHPAACRSLRGRSFQATIGFGTYFFQHVPPRPDRFICPDHQEISAIPQASSHRNFRIRQAREKPERLLFKQGRKLCFFHGQAFGNPKNPSDPDATYDGHKGKGYQVQVAETFRSGDEAPALSLITHINVEPMHHHDSEALVPAIERTKKWGCTQTNAGRRRLRK